MKTLTKLSPIALAVAALCISTGAVARDVTLGGENNFNKNINKNLEDNAKIEYFNDVSVEIDKAIDVTKTGDVLSVITFKGEDIPIASFTQSLLDNKQLNINNWDKNTEVTNDAEIELIGNTGNVGANAAAGDYNQQKNEVAIAVSDAPDTNQWLDAEVFTYQDYEFNTQENTDVTNIADIVINGGSGNIGANSAAGTGNQQSNALAIAVGVAVLAEATGYIKQQNDNNTVTNNFVDNEAFLSVSNFSGNVGANVAAGVGNQQANSVSISVSRTGIGVNEILR